MDDRTLTLIVVPHGDLETRSFIVTYRKLKIILGLTVALAVVLAFIVATWFPVALLAAKVPVLTKELETLEAERAKVAELAKALSDVEAQYKKVRELLGADAPVAGSPPTLPPLRSDSPPKEEPSPLSGINSQINDISLWPLSVRGFLTQQAGSSRKSHPGIDIAVASNSDVRAAGAGVVLASGSDNIYGKFIVLGHGGGFETVYGHLNSMLVQRGASVRQGQRIALSGSTGRSTGSHLHFEIRHDQEFLDPLRFVHQPN